MKNTKGMKRVGGFEKTHFDMSFMAWKIYYRIEPVFAIYEEETEDGFRYSVRSFLGDYDDLTAEEVEEMLINF